MGISRAIRRSMVHSIRKNIYAWALLISIVATTAHTVSAQQKDGADKPATQPPHETAAQTLENLNIAELAKLGIKNSARMNKELLNYTYNLKKVRRTLNETGKETEKEVSLYEAYPVKGAHVLVALSRNGNMLLPHQVYSERRVAGRELEIAYREEEKHKEQGEASSPEPDSYFSAGIMGKYRGKNGHVSINPTDFLTFCDLTSPTLKKVDDRDIVVLKFQSRLDAKLPYAKSYIAKLVGEVWIDLTDQSLIRVEGWPSQKTPEVAVANHPTTTPKPVLVYEQKRLRDGNWVPNFIRMNSEGDETLFNGLNWDVQFELTDYKRFNASVSDVKIDAKDKQ